MVRIVVFMGIILFLGSCGRSVSSLPGVWVFDCAPWERVRDGSGIFTFKEVLGFNEDGTGWCSNKDVKDSVIYFNWYSEENNGKTYLHVVYSDSCQETFEVRFLRWRRLRLRFLGSSQAPYIQCSFCFTGNVRYPHCHYIRLESR